MVGQLSSRILVVDDDPVIRKVITSHLVAAGYVVRGAMDGLDALRKMRAGIPDLLITDLKMPGMSGVELITIVRHRFPHMPVIAISAGCISDMSPADLAVDALHNKDRMGLEDLMQSVSSLTRDPASQLHAVVPEEKSARAYGDGDGHYEIRCEECLRSFKVARILYTGNRRHWVTCVHCGGTIQFLVDLPPASQ